MNKSLSRLRSKCLYWCARGRDWTTRQCFCRGDRPLGRRGRSGGERQVPLCQAFSNLVSATLFKFNHSSFFRFVCRTLLILSQERGLAKMTRRISEGGICIRRKILTFMMSMILKLPVNVKTNHFCLLLVHSLVIGRNCFWQTIGRVAFEMGGFVCARLQACSSSSGAPRLGVILTNRASL